MVTATALAGLLAVGTRAMLTPMALAQKQESREADDAQRAPITAQLATRVYDVTDLLFEIPNVFKDSSQSTAKPGADKRVLDLKDLIQKTVAADTWSDVGGGGSLAIARLPSAGVQLVISQTPKVHEQITDLLSQLRQGLGAQITVESRFIAIEQEKLPADVRQLLANAQSAVPGAYLNNDQVAEIIRASQASDSVLVSAPRITTVNGGEAEVAVTSPVEYTQAYSSEATANGTRYVPVTNRVETGLRLAVRSNASVDRSSVTVLVETKLSSLAGLDSAPWPGNAAAGQTLTVQLPRLSEGKLRTLCTIPDQQTVLLGGLAEMASKRGSTVFRQASTKPAEDRDPGTKWFPVYLLLKPTIIVSNVVKPEGTRAR